MDKRRPGGSVVTACDDASHTGPVTVAVFDRCSIARRIVGVERAAQKRFMCRHDAGVKDVRFAARSCRVVPVLVIEGKCSLVDAIESPSRGGDYLWLPDFGI